ncbi:30S ribosomal protein S7 [Methanosarcinales archaeon]|uniref:Small ribosomal subunit protein uS7 n=1 Tax=Candidatus Syntropharchaeum caldarium TaxID=1838285 RepID=A0A1F2P8B3_9EURY|nr:MAG: Ribosomal protein S7, eukaryotic/archaeal [Candidatus Syntrophoarchaeum caldarius]RLG33186.1 MAG: 30S ribosomal protein S7 [Methanosarcinales archaeon]
MAEESFGSHFLVFGKWSCEGLEFKDLGIDRCIGLEGFIVPYSTGAKKRFDKIKMPIVERLINKIMRGEHNTGKKQKAYNIVKEAFEIIAERTNKNPLQVFITAIENAGPREEIVRLKFGGISVPKSVDTSPLRRVDQALMNIAKGAKRSAFKSKRSISECLATEIIAAANYDVRAFSIAKKEEKERIAKAAR